MSESADRAAELRVERGCAGPEELAALAVVLLARRTVMSPDPSPGAGPSRATWARRGRTYGGYGAPRGWR
ncbi:acyl-CoA carboxylase epsilon subunit [Streptomyces sp. NPDC048594]|uniref:acyl-CoA carboxylase epsilon subunit n=1 Tax=Streptomyces sp. NPDC048594 TaxID=3365575 RepID=UPI0037196BE5